MQTVQRQLLEIMQEPNNQLEILHGMVMATNVC